MQDSARGAALAGLRVVCARPGEPLPAAYFAARYGFLRAPLGAPPGAERLADDSDALHVWVEAVEGGEVLAVARAHVVEGDGAAADHAGPGAARTPGFGPLGGAREGSLRSAAAATLRPAVQVRQMGVSEAHRRRGLGAAALARLLKEAVAVWGARSGWLQAREGAVGFYARLGWQEVDEPFTITGVGPHRSMWRSLS